MNILEEWLRAHPVDATADIPLYEIVAEEIESGILHKGTWTKAFAEAGGDREKTRAIYLKLRVAQLPQEIAAFQTSLAKSRRTFQQRLQDIQRGNIPDMDHILSSRFDGDPSSLSEPIPIATVSSMTGLIEFQIVDLIKAGRLRGVRQGQDWFVDGTYVGEPNP